MKIAFTSNYDTSYRSKKLKSYNNEPLNCSKNVKSNISFGAAGGNKTIGLFKFIEKSGFFIEFLILDTLSMILPRVAVGLNRDRDKTGRFNYQAGAEEAGREILSGPSMHLIPMGILAVVSHFKSASRMDKSSLGALTANMNQVVKETPDLTNKAELDKLLADKIFEGAFDPTKLTGEKRDKLKGEFRNLLASSSDSNKKMFNNEVFKNNISEFQDLVVKINNSLVSEEAPLNSKGISLKSMEEVVENGVKTVKQNKVSMSAAELFEDFGNYSKDVIEKLSKTKHSGNVVESAQNFLNKAKKSRMGLKTATAAAAFLAVGTFLLYLPKVYQLSKISPAKSSAKRARGEAPAQGGANENK